jgi:hypothetical protein
MSPYQNESSLLIDSFPDRASVNAIANERLASALLFFGRNICKLQPGTEVGL